MMAEPRPTLWWLSFCDGRLPKGSQFLGACVVCAPDFLTAVTVSHLYGCNPGGEVLGFPLELLPSQPPIHDQELYVLFDKQACADFDARHRSVPN